MKLIPFRDTPLEPLKAEDRIDKAGELLIASVGDEVVACDPAGDLRWKFPAWGWPATGERGDICVYAGGPIHGLSPEDGRLTWTTYFRPDNWDRIRDVAVVGGRLVMFSEKWLGVYDAETGKLLVNMPQNRRLVRRASHIYDVLLRMTLAGNVLVVGFEDRVFGVDLTPPAEVPARFQVSDPANAASELGSLAKPPGGSGQQSRRLAESRRATSLRSRQSRGSAWSSYSRAAAFAARTEICKSWNRGAGTGCNGDGGCASPKRLLHTRYARSGRDVV